MPIILHSLTTVLPIDIDLQSNFKHSIVLRKISYNSQVTTLVILLDRKISNELKWYKQ